MLRPRAYKRRDRDVTSIPNNFIGRAEKAIDSMTILILKHFRQMENFAGSTKRPFMFGISDKVSIDRLD
jgi:hypothetical protein